MQQKRKTWIEPLIAVLSVLLGLIIGPLFEKITAAQFDIEVRAVLISILAIGIITVIALTALGMFVRVEDARSKEFAWTIEEIRKKLGLSAKFIYDLPRQEGTGELYRIANEIISQAESEIWVLWHREPHIGRRNEDDSRSSRWKTERSSYHETIFRKCAEQKGKTFFYRRILQLPNSHEIKNGIVGSDVLSPTMITHCRQLLQYIRKNPETAVLKYAPIFFPHTVVLVDNRYAMLEIDAIDPDTQSDYMDSILLFDDSNKEFVRYLKDFFLKVDAHASLVKGIAE